jgi:hypothetical protein
VGQSVGNSADGAVPASSNNKINVCCDGLSGDSSAWILDRCFQPQCVAPALLLEAFFDKGANLSLILVGL